MLLTGNPISAADALNSGLISKMTKDSEELEVEIESICQAIISKPRAVIALGKKFYYEQLEMGLTQAFEAGNPVFPFFIFVCLLMLISTFCLHFKVEKLW